MKRWWSFARAWLWVLVTYEIYRLQAWWNDKPLKRQLGHCFPKACDCRRPNVVAP